MIKSINNVRVYEEDGKESKYLDGPSIQVINHWNRNSFVIIEMEGKNVTVLASELIKAINNATNV